MANDNLSTGRTQLNAQLLEGAANLAGPAAQLAAGASKMDVATGVLKDAFMNKLLGPTAVFSGSLIGALVTMRRIVRESQILERGLKGISNIQQIEGKFETLLKSATAAKQRVKELHDFARNSPFKFAGVAEANLQLESLTRGAFSGKEAMRMIGDAAAATGTDIAEMANITARAYYAIANGKSLDRLMFQFQGTGILTDTLADKLKFLESTGGSATEKWAAFSEALNSNSGAMEKEMDSLESLNSNLEKSRQLQAEAFSAPFAEAQANSIKTMTAATENLTPVLAQVGKDMAEVSGMFTQFKTNVTTSVVALPGMQTALMGVWDAFKVGLSVLAAMSATSLLKGTGEMIEFIGTVKGAAEKSKSLGAALSAAGSAKARWIDATKAASAMNFEEAASCAVSSAALMLNSYRLRLHAIGTEAATAGTTEFSLSNYLLATSLSVAGVAANLAGKAFKFLSRQAISAVTALFTNPFTATIAALTVVGLAIHSFSRAAKEAAESVQRVNDAASELRKTLRDGFDGVKNLDDWSSRLMTLRQEYRAAMDEVARLNAKAAKSPLGNEDREALQIAQNKADKVGNAILSENGRNLSKLGLGNNDIERIRADEEAARAQRDAAFQQKVDTATNPEDAIAVREQHAKELEARAARARDAWSAQQLDARSGTAQAREWTVSAMTFSEKERGAERAKIEGRSLDQLSKSEQERLARVRGGKGRDGYSLEQAQAAFNAKKKADLAAFDAVTDKIKAKHEDELAQLNRTSLDPAVQLRQQIDDASQRGASGPKLEALHRKLSEAEYLRDNSRSIQSEASGFRGGLTKDARARDREAGLSKIEATFAPGIDAATRARNGAEVDRLTNLREAALLTQEILHAEEDHDLVLVRQLKLRKSALDAAEAARKSDRVDARGDIRVEAASNRLEARGDVKGAQALRDAKTLRDKQKQYKDLGLNPAQAASDFKAEMLANAARRNATVVADSRQAIGGGGGAFQGSNPVVSALQRVERAIQANTGEIKGIRGLYDE
jgi:hypothetical protein